MDGDRLDGLLADAIAAEAARERTRQRWLREAAEDEATLVGTLVLLAETRERVALHVAAGRVHRGVLSAVGRDFVVVRDESERPTLVALAALTSVRSASSRSIRTDVAGAQPAPVEASLRAVLNGVADERPMVQVGVRGEAPLVLGTLRSVGVDVMSVQLTGAEAAVVVVPLTAVSEVVLLDG